jgi:hypothetical protein
VPREYGLNVQERTGMYCTGHCGHRHLYAPLTTTKDVPLFEKNESYTPAEAKRALEQLDQLVADKTITARQAGAYRRHVFSHVRLTLKPEYTRRLRSAPKLRSRSSRKQARSRSRWQQPIGRTSPSAPWRPKWQVYGAVSGPPFRCA